MKICAISDTHKYHDTVQIKKCDVLIHSGDVCGQGTLLEFYEFVDWFSSINVPHKILVAGNHDWCLDLPIDKPLALEYLKNHCSNCTYLQDSSVEIEGIKFYGSSWQPNFCNWAFNLPRNSHQLELAWEMIPDDTDILITHTPPEGILDQVLKLGYPQTQNKVFIEHCGCEKLAERLKSLNIKVHHFGHIHEAYGTLEKDNTLYINSCICDGIYSPINKPIYYTINLKTKKVKLLD